MNKVCYTFIFGDYDDLKEPTVVSDGWRYVCFSDRPRESKVWEVIELDLPLDNSRSARLCLTMPFKFIEYDIAVSVGGQIEINYDLNLLPIGKFIALEHPHRNCVYQEAEACIRLGKDDEYKITKQALRYKSEGYPIGNGMIATGITIRLNNQEVNDFCKDWFYEILLESFRDQLSFNYVAWKRNFKYITLPFSLLYKEFTLHSHKHKKK